MFISVKVVISLLVSKNITNYNKKNKTKGSTLGKDIMIIVLSLLKAFINNYNEKLLKLDLRTLLKFLFFEFADYILPWATYLGGYSIQTKSRSPYKKVFLTFNWNICQSRFMAREKIMRIKLKRVIGETQSNQYHKLGKKKTFCNKANFIYRSDLYLTVYTQQ